MNGRHRNIVAGGSLLALVACTGSPGVSPGASPGAQAPADIQKAVDAAYEKFRTLQEGKNADYIPALAKVDPNLFGIALVTADGKVYTAGDITTEAVVMMRSSAVMPSAASALNITTG